MASHDPRKRVRAIRQLMETGGNCAWGAIPSLVKVLVDPSWDVRVPAAHAINMSMAPDVRQAVVNNLRRQIIAKQSQEVLTAGRALLALGEFCADAISALLAEIPKIENEKYRSDVEWALRGAGRNLKKGILALIKFLSHDNAVVRRLCVISLGLLAEDAVKALPALEARYDDPDPIVRKKVRTLIGIIKESQQ